jgi:hypothetical protein
MRAVVLLFAVCLVHIAAPTAAHECVLGGTSASEITIYNSCKNDLIMGQSGHAVQKDEAENQDNTALTARIKALEAENQGLRARLETARRQLLDLAKDL